MRTREMLRVYQNYLAHEIVERDVLVAVEMSLGKTVATLTALRKLFDQGAIRRALIIAPLRVARDTWPDEIEEWNHTRLLSYTLIRAEDDSPEVVEAGDRAYAEAYAYQKARSEARIDENLSLGMTKKQARLYAGKGLPTPSAQAQKVRQKAETEAKIALRQRLSETDTDIHIINREAVPWLVKHYGKNWPYDAVVFDESSRLKAGRKRTAGGKKDSKKPRTPAPLSEFGSLCAVRKYVTRIVELTGTPSPNGVRDLWAQIYLLDQGKRLGTSRTAFERRWFDSDYMGWTLTPKPQAVQEIMDLCKDVMIGLRAEDYIKLPPVIPNIVKIRLTDKQMREYREFEKTLVSEAYDVEAVSRGVLTNKLLQFSNGGLYRQTDDGKRETIHIHDLKLDALDSIVEEAAGRSILVAYSFKFDLERLKKRFPKAVVFDDDPSILKRWNSGKIPMLLAHPASVGHGLNMQYGGNIAVWFGLTWSLELYLQFNARLPRPGQPEKHVFIHHIVTEGTVDEDMVRVLNSRGITQDEINDAVRVRLSQN